MLKRTCLLAFVLGGIAWSAPLPWENPKAQEALKTLSTSGLLQESWLSYRAATRWEIATIAERLLRKWQSESGSFSGKVEREALEILCQECRDELEALGVRTESLEGKVGLVESRVEDLERIRFRGQFLMTSLYQGVSNTGSQFSGFGPDRLDYTGLAGSTGLTNLVPHGPQGIVPPLDMALGRPLIQGAGFTSTLFLEVETQPDEDWLYQLRVYAYTSQGNALLDSIWGTQQPYLANPFTGSGGSNSQNSNHSPFSSAGFDRFRVTHIPSGFGMTLGSYTPRLISSQVFVGQVNPRVGNPRLLESFGAHATAEHGPFSWEILGTYLPDGNPPQLALQPLQNMAWGGALHYANGEWQGTASFLQANASSRDGTVRSVGLSNLVNGRTGQINVNWVNPNGFFTGQLGPGQAAGIGSSSDKRPVPGRPGLDGGGPEASFGPQQQRGFGLQLGYRSESGWGLQGEWAHTNYRPNQNSSFSRDGNLWAAGGNLDFGDIQMQLDYRWTDPTYDPMVLVYPSPSPGLTPFRAYHRFPDHDQFWHMYSLHDTDRFPHNRRGFWPTLKWSYDEDCHLNFRGRFLEQVRTSLQDVRVRPGQLGQDIPNELVLGHSPGFFDVVFREYSPLSFDGQLNPLEDRRGSVFGIGLDLHHSFEDSPWALDLNMETHRFRRGTGLSANQGGSQNNVDFSHSLAKLTLHYQASQTWSYRFIYGLAEMKGHYDPLGVYNNFAIANQSVDFRNRDILQHTPAIEATWNLDSQTRWDFGFTYYSTLDRVPQQVFAGTPGGPHATAHPFAYNAYRIQSRLEVNF